ncbi:MAG: tetratricopeptide repeat protein [Myxococcota bacterium]
MESKPVESKFSRRMLAGLLVALTLGVYLPVVENGYIWDDGDYVFNNATLTSVDGLRRMWFELAAIPQYYPLVHTSYWLEYRLWGLDPVGYHIVNVLLHALGSLLLWRVLSLLGVPGAWWASAIFALHPVHVESVAWITERKNVLSGVFYFASFLSYLHWAGFGQPRPTAGRTARTDGLYAVSLLLFIAALLCKTVTLSLPAVLLIVTWWKGRSIDRSVALALAPFLAVGFMFGFATSIYETHLVGAVGSVWDLSAVERVLLAGRALWFYLAKLLWPHPLIFNYPRWQLDPAALWQYLYPLLAVGFGALLLVLARRIGRGAISAAMIFAGTLLPALGFFNVYPMRYSFVADHFQYLASAAPIAYLCGVVSVWASRSGRLASRIAAIAGAVILGVLGTLTWQQIPMYRDVETLWRTTLTRNPDSWLSHSSLCAIEQERGELDPALEHCEAAMRLEPDNHESHHMFAILAISRGEVEVGIRHYERALEIQPDFPHSSNGLGATLNSLERYDEAMGLFRDVLRLYPDYAEAHTNLGNALAATGELDAAIEQHRRAIELNPDLAAAHNNLAAALLRKGELGLARIHLERLLELTPDSTTARRSLDAIERLNRNRADR